MVFDLLQRFRRKQKEYRPLGKKYRSKPVEPWAFMRVKNEIHTIQTCLDSIAPAIKKGVIGYHRLADNEHDDGTIEIIENFCKTHSGFIPYFYDHVVIPPTGIQCSSLDEVPKEVRLDSYYNAVLEQIPENEWMIKIDADHVFDADKLRALFYLPKNDTEVISIGRMNLHYANGELYIMKDFEYVDPGDSWLLKNTNLFFSMEKPDSKSESAYTYEILNLRNLLKRKTRYLIRTDLCNWHFPVMKESRSVSEDKLILFKEYVFTERKLKKWRIDSSMVDENRILHWCKSFR